MKFINKNGEIILGRKNNKPWTLCIDQSLNLHTHVHGPLSILNRLINGLLLQGVKDNSTSRTIMHIFDYTNNQLKQYYKLPRTHCRTDRNHRQLLDRTSSDKRTFFVFNLDNNTLNCPSLCTHLLRVGRKQNNYVIVRTSKKTDLKKESGFDDLHLVNMSIRIRSKDGNKIRAHVPDPFDGSEITIPSCTLDDMLSAWEDRTDITTSLL